MARALATPRLLMQNVVVAMLWGVVGPLVTLLWHEPLTREPNGLVLSVLAMLVAVRTAQRAGYIGTLLATLGTTAIYVGVYVAGEWMAHRLGGPPHWLPDRSWLVRWCVVLGGFAVLARYNTVVVRARRIRARRPSARAV